MLSRSPGSLSQAPALAEQPRRGGQGGGGDPRLSAQRGSPEGRGAESQGLAEGRGGPAGGSATSPRVCVPASAGSSGRQVVKGNRWDLTAQTQGFGWIGLRTLLCRS